MIARRGITAVWLAATLVLTVAWPGTPPGNFVRDASGAVTKAGTALCTTARPAQPAFATVAALPVSAIDLELPTGFTLAAHAANVISPPSHAAPPPSARAPPLA